MQNLLQNFVVDKICKYPTAAICYFESVINKFYSLLST